TALNFAGGALQYASGNTTDISSRTVSINAGGGTIDTGGNSVTFANSIGNSGAGGLTKRNTGTLTLSSANTYTGGTTMTGGTLVMANPAGLGPASSVALSGGAIWDIQTDGSDNLYTLNIGSG